MKIYIGTSDIATLIIAGPDAEDPGKIVRPLKFGIDGDYWAYIVDKDAEIGEHYHLEAVLKSWIKIYDDNYLILKDDADRIEIYRAGNEGCIIKFI